MPAGTAAIVFGILFLIIGLILIFAGLYYVLIIRKRNITVGQQWVYWGIGSIFAAVGIILIIIGDRVNRTTLARITFENAIAAQQIKGITLATGNVATSQPVTVYQQTE